MRFCLSNRGIKVPSTPDWHEVKYDGYRLRVERAFVRDMHAFFAEKASIKRDAIAARQISALRQYQQSREKPVRIPDVKEMFLQMRDHA